MEFAACRQLRHARNYLIYILCVNLSKNIETEQGTGDRKRFVETSRSKSAQGYAVLRVRTGYTRDFVPFFPSL